MTLHLGKHPATALRPGTVRYSDLRLVLVKDAKVTLPLPPRNFGHANAFPGDSWLMLGNGPDDSVEPGFGGCGDCALAQPAHEIMEAAKTSGRTIPKITGKTVVGWYSDVTGYVLDDPSTDQGSNMQDVLAYRQTTGLTDDDGTTHKIGQYVALTPGNLQELWEAAWLFERVAIGVQIQQAQQDQFGAGQPWKWIPGPPVIGGHAVPVMGKLGLVTWGRREGFTPGFIVNACDEAYAMLDNDLYAQATGKTAEGFSKPDLEKYLTLVARMGGAAKVRAKS